MCNKLDMKVGAQALSVLSLGLGMVTFKDEKRLSKGDYEDLAYVARPAWHIALWSLGPLRPCLSGGKLAVEVEKEAYVTLPACSFEGGPSNPGAVASSFILKRVLDKAIPELLSLIASLEYKKEKGFILITQKEDEMMKVQNNSIVINCDGFYLISLKGYFSQNISISLHYQEHEEPLFQLKKVRSVNSLMVASLTYKDKIYLNVTTDSTSPDDFYVNGGELILIHQNPGEYCVP
nr:uncharacterized protein LOC110569331 [Aotus nancymaae]